MRKKLFCIITICLIMLLPLSVTNTAYATTESSISTENSGMYIDMKTKEISEVSLTDIETKAKKVKADKNIVVNGNTVLAAEPNKKVTTLSTIETPPLLNPENQTSPKSIIDNIYPQLCTPNPKICMIMTKFPNDTKEVIGTGFFVGSNLVLTAAHNVYDSRRGGVADYAKIAPGATWNTTTNSLNMPFGTNSDIIGVHLDSGWLNGQNSEQDWAIIKFGGTFDGGFLPGWLAFAYSEGYDFFVNDGLIVSVRGYRNDAAPIGLYNSTGRVQYASNTFLGYRASTYNGTSGGPVVHRDDIAVGIHVSGVGGPVSGLNTCRNINKTVFETILWYY